VKLIGRRFTDYYDYLCYQYQDDHIVYDRDKVQNELDKEWEKRLGNFPRVVGDLYRSDIYHPTPLVLRRGDLKIINILYFAICNIKDTMKTINGIGAEFKTINNIDLFNWLIGLDTGRSMKPFSFNLT
jgi:hypothetical protein